MIALKDGRITSTPLEGVIGELNLLDLDTQYEVEWLRPTNRMFCLDGEPLIRMWQSTRSEPCFMLCVAENRCKARQYFLGYLPKSMAQGGVELCWGEDSSAAFFVRSQGGKPWTDGPKRPFG